MSRTPETIINRKALALRNWLIGGGVVSWLLACGSFASEDKFGQGLLFALLGGGLFFVASKIKVRWHKTSEVSSYR